MRSTKRTLVHQKRPKNHRLVLPSQLIRKFHDSAKMDIRARQLLRRYGCGTPPEAYVNPLVGDDEWEAQLFHAWLNDRDIPLADLCVLFHRDCATVERWLALGPEVKRHIYLLPAEPDKDDTDW